MLCSLLSVWKNITLNLIYLTACFKVWCSGRKLLTWKTGQSGFRIWSAEDISTFLDILFNNRIWSWGTLWSEARIWRHGVRYWGTDAHNGPWGTLNTLKLVMWNSRQRHAVKKVTVPVLSQILAQSHLMWSRKIQWKSSEQNNKISFSTQIDHGWNISLCLVWSVFLGDTCYCDFFLSVLQPSCFRLNAL